MRWHTIEAEMNLANCASVIQIADWRMMPHVINSGTVTRPVSRSDTARLHSSRLVIDRRYLFLAIKTKTKPLTVTINTARTIAGTSALGSKKPWYISSCLSSASGKLVKVCINATIHVLPIRLGFIFYSSGSVSWPS